MKKAILAAAVCVFILTACGDPDPTPTTEPRDPPGPLLEKAFEIFYDFEGSNYTPPNGFENQKTGVDYGTLTEKTYYSNTTKANKKCNVYTPPGYDENETYPVLFLLHGGGGDQNEWINAYSVENKQGRMVQIMGNLYNTTPQKVKPMIIVTPNSRGSNPDSVSLLTDEQNIQSFFDFVDVLQNDLLPFIEQNYPISKERNQRAVAGLSMGGVATLNISLHEFGYKTFGYFGIFSSPDYVTQARTIPREYKNKTFIMLCAGTEDTTGGALQTMRKYRDEFTANGLYPAYYDIPGPHGFTVWNNALYYFAQCIFW